MSPFISAVLQVLFSVLALQTMLLKLSTHNSATMCNLQIIPSFEDYEYYKEGDIIIGGMFTVHSAALDYTLTGKRFGEIICFGPGWVYAGYIRRGEHPQGLNILDEIHLKQTPSILMALDAKKAFDRVNWRFMLETLRVFEIDGIFLVQLHQYIKNIRYVTASRDQISYFDQNGEFVYYYLIVNWVIINEYIVKNINVGNFTPWSTERQQLIINEEVISWKSAANKIPVSQCSKICLPGYRKILYSIIHPCCYDCVQCSDGEISLTINTENCIKCPEFEWPNENKYRCIPKEVEYLSYTNDILADLFAVISILFIILTLFILMVFISYRNTHIVKANNRNLSFTLLVSIALSFNCVFLFLGRPLDITCMLRQVSFGVIFSVSVSCVLAKTIIVYTAFKVTKPGSKWKTWIGVKLSNSIVLILSSIQVIISICWLSISPPFQEIDTRSYQWKIIIQCNEGSVIAFYSVLGYMGFLATVSFVMAFLARTLPDSFNEAKYITFSMLVFSSVWIAMIPAYLSTKGKYMVAVEVFAILTSSAGLLGCIFLPKCYIILIRSEINKKTNVGHGFVGTCENKRNVYGES
ncbi:vomeronasal type-2 receptor 26-like [Pelobates fuscus]|uniref:vomeronasal type-2 receptor 26-like n=1 Tax=Pelobates fuscus TaxID=191477 RepID=UPI002FE45A08